MRAWLSQSSFASQAMGWQNSPIVFGNDLNVHQRIIHTLWMPNTCSHDILAGNYFAYNWDYKSRHHLIKRLQTLERLELLVGVEAGLKNEVTQLVRDFHRRQAFWTELLGCYACGAGSTPMTEIFCEYLSFTRLPKLLAYSESTGIPLDQCPVRLSFFSFWKFMYLSK